MGNRKYMLLILIIIGVSSYNRVADLSLSLKRESKVRDFIEVGREFQSLMAEE